MLDFMSINVIFINFLKHLPPPQITGITSEDEKWGFELNMYFRGEQFKYQMLWGATVKTDEALNLKKKKSLFMILLQKSNVA